MKAAKLGTFVQASLTVIIIVFRKIAVKMFCAGAYSDMLLYSYFTSLANKASANCHKYTSTSQTASPQKLFPILSRL